MNKAFEKILDMLEEERELSYADFSRYVEEVSPCLDAEYDDFFHRGLERASRLVREVAEEYKGGWVPCSEKLPSGLDFVLYTHKDGEVDICSIEYFYDYLDRFTAWQPLPEPYKEW